MTLPPASLLSPAMSSTSPDSTLWMRQPLSCLTHFQRWLNLLFMSYCMMRSPGLRVAPGTSNAFPESLLIRTKLELMVWFSFTSQNLQRWVSALGSAMPNLSEPYRQSPLSPFSLVRIQQQVQKPGKLALVMAKSWLDFCLPNQRRISLPSQLKTRPVFKLTNQKSSTLEPTLSMQKS